MKITNKFILVASALLFSVNANAHMHMLQYNLDFTTTGVEGSAFGDVMVGNTYQGSLSVNMHALQDLADEGGGYADVIVPLTTYDSDSDSDVFNLSYSVNIGDYDFTEQTAASFDSEFTVDDPANVGGISAFSMEIGDSSFNDLSLSYEMSGGTWSATDGNTFNVVSGTFTVSAVPVPAAVWMFGSGLIGLIGVKRKKA